MLRTLAQYYGKDPGGQILFMVRIAQGILHAGKGSITLSPFHTERSLMSNVAMSGILPTLISALDLKNVLLKNHSHMLFHLSLAMYPRILCTFAADDDLTPINTSVRVGQAVDVVGQAGTPSVAWNMRVSSDACTAGVTALLLWSTLLVMRTCRSCGGLWIGKLLRLNAPLTCATLSMWCMCQTLLAEHTGRISWCPPACSLQVNPKPSRALSPTTRPCCLASATAPSWRRMSSCR